MICPTCKRTLTSRTAPRRVVELSAADRAKLTDGELFAYYARTSHLEDIDFFMRHARPEIIDRDSWLGLRARAPRMPKGTAQREYRALVDRYWRAVAIAERARAYRATA